MVQKCNSLNSIFLLRNLFSFNESLNRSRVPRMSSIHLTASHSFWITPCIRTRLFCLSLASENRSKKEKLIWQCFDVTPEIQMTLTYKKAQGHKQCFVKRRPTDHLIEKCDQKAGKHPMYVNDRVCRLRCFYWSQNLGEERKNSQFSRNLKTLAHPFDCKVLSIFQDPYFCSKIKTDVLTYCIKKSSLYCRWFFFQWQTHVMAFCIYFFLGLVLESKPLGPYMGPGP